MAYSIDGSETNYYSQYVAAMGVNKYINISSNPPPMSIWKGTRTIIPKQTSQKNPQCVVSTCANDPSAGSPTETLLRLLLPLSDKVH